MNNKILLYALVAMFLSSCSSTKTGINETDKNSGSVTLKFVQVNDVYEIAPLNAGEYGGMARVAHIRDSIKNIFPNTYLVMAGDFLSPSLIGSIKVDGERLKGKQMIDVMNAMDFDLVTFGNHEFDLDDADFQKRLNESTFQWTSANVKHNVDGTIIPFITKQGNLDIPVPEYSFLTAKNELGKEIKVGLFSVTLPANPREYVYYGDIYSEAKKAYEEVSKESDLVLALTHVSIGEDMEIAQLLPDLPLIMGGHEHNNITKKEGKTIIAKADSNAKTAYVHTITVDLASKVTQINSQLVQINHTVKSAPAVEKIVQKWTDLLNEKIKEVIDNPDEIIFKTAVPIDATDKNNRSIQTNLGHIVTKGMAYGYDNKVDAVFVNGGSFRMDEMLEGSISSKDIFSVMPFGGSVLKVELKGFLLKQILDFGEEKAGTGAYLHRENILKDAEGNWLIGGKLIEDENKYTVATSDFLLKGYDIPFLKPETDGIVNVYYPEKNELAGDIRKAIIAYLKSQNQ